MKMDTRILKYLKWRNKEIMENDNMCNMENVGVLVNERY